MSHRSSARRWTRDEIAAAVLRGDLLTIYDDRVLRLNSWLPNHPGGELALLHFVGRDATDEIEAYHSERTLKERIGRFCVGELADEEKKGYTNLLPPTMLGFQLSRSVAGDISWVPLDGPILALEKGRAHSSQPASLSPSPTLQLSDLYPPPPPPSLSSEATQRKHQLAYRRLHQRIRAAGLYQAPPYGGYLSDILRYLLLAGIFLALLSRGIGDVIGSWSRWATLTGSAVSLGLCWDQLTFLAHDAGHTSVLGGDYFKNRVLGVFIANFVGGLSLGWWTDSHDTHHLVTNHPEHDPDIQHVPFFAISPIFFDSIFSTYFNHTKHFDAFSSFMVRHQEKTYYVILALARFNLYANSYGFLLKQGVLKGRRSSFWWFEVAGVATFWAWFGWGVLGALGGGWKEKLAFLLISHICASPVHVQIVLSHFSRSTEDLGVFESFAHRQLRTTMDVICSPSIEFIHGGLDKQVTHHLFPRLPRHNLRAASLLVKEFCKEQGLEFAEYRWMEGNKQVLGVLREVAQQVQFIGKVAKAQARGELSQGK